MQAASADSSGQGPNVENAGGPAGLGVSSPDAGALGSLAQNMAETIIRSLLRQVETVKPEVSRSDRDQEALAEELAEELASAVVEGALREASRGRPVGGFQSSRASGEKWDDEGGENTTFTDECGGRDFLNEVKEPQTKDIQPYHPPLSHSGLPIEGSLDYPDAPPTTPLLPEPERNRHSFTRKLKGGLARVFLPSPPPPTPKDGEDEGVPGEDEGGSTRTELIEHLMHSLCTDDYPEAGPRHEAFAEALSCSIIDWVLSRDGTSGEGEVQALAHRLAQTIITSSLSEVTV